MPGSTDPIQQMIEYLTDERFGKISDGVYLSAERMARKDGSIAVSASNFAKELKALSHEQLRALYDQALQRQADQTKARLEKEEAERYFNKPFAMADFTHWAKAPYWTIEEAIALSLGRDPEKVNWKHIQDYKGESAFALKYALRRDLARRAVAMKQLTDGVLPGMFLGWAQRNDLDVPEILVELVKKIGQKIADWPAMVKAAQESEEATLKWAKETTEKASELAAAASQQLAEATSKIKQRDQQIAQLQAVIDELRSRAASQKQQIGEKLNPKERHSFLKLVLGMAIDGYGYDSTEKKSPTPKELVDCLAKWGISIDEDTVRSKLKEAANTVSLEKPP